MTTTLDAEPNEHDRLRAAAEAITDEQIQKLKRVAGATRNFEVVRACEDALPGSKLWDWETDPKAPVQRLLTDEERARARAACAAVFADTDTFAAFDQVAQEMSALRTALISACDAAHSRWREAAAIAAMRAAANDLSEPFSAAKVQRLLEERRTVEVKRELLAKIAAHLRTSTDENAAQALERAALIDEIDEVLA